MTDRAARWARGDAVLWRVSGDRLVLKAVAGDEVIVLGPTGVALWEEMSGEPAPLGDLASRLSTRFGVDATTVVRDLEPVLADLHARALVRRCR